MAMTLSAIMNLTGNFAAEMRRNAEAMQGVAKQAIETGNAIKKSLPENIGQRMARGLAVAKDALGEAGVASAGFLKSCVDGAANAQKVNANLAQTIKSTGGAAGLTADEVSKMASEMTKTNLASAGMIKQGQAVLLTFTNIGKDTFPQASQAMIDLAQKMGTDTTSAARMLGKALGDPSEGINTLKRAMVQLDPVAQQQIKTMQASGDMVGAQKVMLDALNKAVGGQSAAALNTYSGQMEKLSQTVGGIKSAIGSVLLPYLTQIAQKLNEGAQVVSKFANEHKQLIAVILSVTGVLGTLIGGASLFAHLKTFLGPTIQGIIDYLDKLPIPIMAIIAVIGLLVTAYTTNFMGFKDFVDGVIGSIVTAFDAATTAFKNTGSAISAVSAFIGSLFGDDAADTAADTLNRIQDIVMSLVQAVKDHMPEIKQVFQDVFNVVANIWNNVLKPVFLLIIQTVIQVVSWVSDHWPQIQKVIETVFKAIMGVWNSVLKPVFSFMISIISQVISWVVSNWPLISQTISTVMNFIMGIITSVLDAIQSFWNTWGQTIMDYVNMVFNNIKIYISTAIHVVEDIIQAVMQAINGDWSGAWQSVCDAVSSIFSGAIQIVQNIIDGIGKIFSDIATVAYNWGKDMIDGIVNGIKDSIGDVENAITNVADTITKHIHFSRPDVGSLRNYEEWMPDFMQGLGNGIKVNTHLVTEPIKDLSLGIKTNTLDGLSGGTNIPIQSTAGKSGSGNRTFQIAKLADSIVVREESDIDKIATALANKLIQTELGMA